MTNSHMMTNTHIKARSIFSSVQSLSRVQLVVTPWTAAHQVSLSFTNSQSLVKLMFIELVMPSNYPTIDLTKIKRFVKGDYEHLYQ